MIYENHRPSHDIVLNDGKIHFEATRDSDRPKLFEAKGLSPKYGIINTKNPEVINSHRRTVDEKLETDEAVEKRLNAEIEAFQDFRPTGHRLVGFRGIWRQDDRLGPQAKIEKRQTLTTGFASMSVGDLALLIQSKGGTVPDGAENDQAKLAALAVDLFDGVELKAQSPKLGQKKTGGKQQQAAATETTP